MKDVSQIERIRAFIAEQGPTRLSKLTKVSRRALQYIQKGECEPTYPTLQKLLQAMEGMQ
jgi:transcriptional regulator with XRE-family HTH domain